MKVFRATLYLYLNHNSELILSTQAKEEKLFQNFGRLDRDIP